MNASSYDLRIQSNAQRYAWTAYHLVIFLASLIGDTLILYATCQKNAFKLHQFIISILQHIAVNDLAISTSYILPRITSLVADSWVLGDSLCSLTTYSIGIFFPTAACLVALLTTSKVLVLKYPLWAARWDKKRAHLICSFIWILPLAPVILCRIDNDDVQFNYRIYSCTAIITANSMRKTKKILSFLVTVAPIPIIIATTIPTLQYLAAAKKSARRVRGTNPWQGALTTALTAIVYCISAIPISVYFICKTFAGENHTDILDRHLFRIGMFMTIIQVISNFFVYTLTIKSFRRFLELKVSSVSKSLSTSRRISSNTTIYEYLYIFFVDYWR